MRAQIIDGNLIRVTIDDGEQLATLVGPVEADIAPLPGLLVWEALQRAGIEPAPALAPSEAPDAPSLSDWRCGLTLWRRPDGTPRIDEVAAKVAELIASGHPLGRIARERLEYANNVTRAQLGQLAGLFGFTETEIEHSLWRAERVRLGDLSGEWPLPAGKGSK